MAPKWALDPDRKGLRASRSDVRCEHMAYSFAPPLFENLGSTPARHPLPQHFWLVRLWCNMYFFQKSLRMVLP